MKEYKFISNTYTDEMTKKVNKYVKQGWTLKEWKVNDNTIVALLERENKNEIDALLIVIYLALLFCLFFFVIQTCVEFYIYLDDEIASLFLNIACLVSIILCACLLANAFIIPFCKWIHKKIKEKQDE